MAGSGRAAGCGGPDFLIISLRPFNPQTQLWSIYWLDNQSGGLNASGVLLPPVVGGFSDGVGVFEGDDELGGRPIRVRYTWSADQGDSWEMNWRMEFHRLA